MTDLSPAAQAVLDEFVMGACGKTYDIHAGLAAALRAATDQVVPHQSEPPCGEDEPWPPSYQLMIDARWEQRQQNRFEILAIADELEKRDG